MEQDKGNRVIVRVPQEIMSIVPQFLECRTKDIRAINDAVQAGDFLTVTKLAHNMKGVGGAYGFDLVSEIGEAMEEAAERHNSALIIEQLATLEKYLAQAEIVPE